MPDHDRDGELIVTYRPHPAGPGVLSIVGDLDYHTVVLLRGSLDELPRGAAEPLVLDLSGVGYCDSTGIAALIIAYRDAQAARTPFALAAVRPDVDRIFRIVGVDDIFTTYATVDQAARELSAVRG
jgi:anti-sigma B factor antagonist